MLFETDRLLVTELTEEMAPDIHLNSLDADNRKFVPDEVFETEQEALDTVRWLMGSYGSESGPLLYAILLKDGGRNIGYVQLCPVEEGWEIGYHIAAQYTGNGYATEAVKGFLPVIAEKKNLSEIYGICLRENAASVRVLENCGFETVFCGKGNYQGETREIIRTLFRI